MKKILVVDDDPGMVRTLKDVLRLHGWNVDGAANGAEAVSAVETNGYAAVLMDVRMPGVDGIAAFREIHRQRPELPVLLMTAYASDTQLAEAVREGVTRILPKPLDLRYILRLLDDVLMSTQAVLIVDDEPAFLSSLADALRAAGHSVIQARSLEDAVAFAKGGEPRVILLHLHLDDLDPTHAVRAMRSVSPAAQLIVYSGFPEEFDRVTTTDIVATLPKPLPMDRLLALVDDALGH